jgi:hypothetical protein
VEPASTQCTLVHLRDANQDKSTVSGVPHGNSSGVLCLSKDQIIVRTSSGHRQDIEPEIPVTGDRRGLKLQPVSGYPGDICF